MPVIAGKRLFHVTTLAMLMAFLFSAGPASAHGKEVNIAVSCGAPDPGRPLTRVCTAVLKYLDGDPVARAHLQLTASREGRVEPAVGPVAFNPLAQEGRYSATITFPAYGRWRMKFRLLTPDSGEAELREELLPPLPGAVPENRAQVQIVLKFGVADVRNLAVRFIHLLAAMLWFALVGLALVLSRLAVPGQQWRLLSRGAAMFPWAAGGSLLLVALTGIYNARYSSPTRPPGLFAPEALARAPFGDAYLTVFILKMILTLAIVLTTTALTVALRRTYVRPLPIIAGAAHGARWPHTALDRQVAWLAAANLVLGLLTFANVVVLAYLHMINHVAAAAGVR